MNSQKLQDRLYLGLGLSARHIGQSADAYRPAGPFSPLDNRNLFLRLPATFMSARGSDRRTNGYGEALWHGTFDASYTRVGDYLVLPTGVFFVASQDPLLPILCVKTNRTIAIVRPNMQVSTASNSYGGYTAGGSATLLTAWPASVLSESRASASGTGLPTDQGVPYWSVLIPAITGVILSPGDLITDDLSRTATITGSELTDLGWRISAKMATT
ncbi:MAG: hypothetical protein QOH05_1825 [Acetobacteraceae bacterium]|jgi:hypothetical protein|nr:hypothetical protein [Acetobacteraceae bacterium]